LKDEEFKDPVYTAMGVFITSWARYKTITTAQSLYPRFIYADTDSIHLEGIEPPDIEVHHSHLGAWKHEGVFTRGRFIRQKTYIEEIEGELHVTCAGMPDTIKEKVTWENFKEGFSSGGKLIPKHIKGGIVLRDTEFTLGKKEIQLDMSKLFNRLLKEADYDEIKEAIKIHGYIETVKKDHVYYHQYKELSQSVKMKYFRKSGTPIDVFATLLEKDVMELLDQLRYG
jgi:hypothetical protein